MEAASVCRLRRILFLACLTYLASFAVAAERKNWALLIAGSMGYSNYRHQADVCHAYHILHDNGFPDERIVVMMFDDIANNPLNPYPGNIINHPNGSNVYPGVPKDYSGTDVRAKVFLSVLQGDAEGVEKLVGRKGKVINSGPDDHVFVYYTDHGGPGVLGMPFDPLLEGRDLVDALKNMHKEKKFAKLVFYMEACESGSIFDGTLPEDINVFATTAANPDESSYPIYCHSDRGSCLGDEYSVNWLENSDAVDIGNETLLQQFQAVRNLTKKSHVMQYGDASFASLVVEQFLGGDSGKEKATTRGVRSFPERSRLQEFHEDEVVATDMVSIHTLERLLVSPHPRHVARRVEIARDLQAQLWTRDQTTQLLADVARRAYPEREDVSWVLEQRSRIHEWDCYGRAVRRLLELCPRMGPSRNDFVLRRLNVLVNLCNSRHEKVVMAAIESAIAAHPICY